MPRQGRLQGRQCLQVHAQQQLGGRRRIEDLVKAEFQILVRHRLEAQRRFAHFTDAPAQGGYVLGAVVGMQAETHFELVDRLRREAGDENAVESPESVVITLEPAHTFLDR